MKSKRVLSFVLMAVGLTTVNSCTLFQSNAVTGLRDGSVTAVSGLIQGFFNRRFNLDSAPDQGGGNDLFAGL